MPLNVNGLALAESMRAVYRVTTTVSDTQECLLDPAWWVHVSRSLRLDDRIEVMAHDRSWFGELIVIEVGRDGGFGGVRVAWLRAPVALSNDATIARPPAEETHWNSMSNTWEVRRIKDKKVLEANFATKEAAIAWIAEWNRDPKAKKAA